MENYGRSDMMDAIRSVYQMSNEFQTMNSRFRTADEQVRLFNQSAGIVSQHTIRREMLEIEDSMMDDIMADAKPKKALTEREPTTMEVWRD